MFAVAALRRGDRGNSLRDLTHANYGDELRREHLTMTKDTLTHTGSVLVPYVKKRGTRRGELVATTVETVRVQASRGRSLPHPVRPVPHVIERFQLTEDGCATPLLKRGAGDRSLGGPP